MPNFAILSNLPRTKFQCLICRRVYKKVDCNEREHTAQCIADKDKEERRVQEAIKHVRKWLREESGITMATDWYDQHGLFDLKTDIPLALCLIINLYGTRVGG